MFLFLIPLRFFNFDTQFGKEKEILYFNIKFNIEESCVLYKTFLIFPFKLEIFLNF